MVERLHFRQMEEKSKSDKNVRFEVLSICKYVIDRYLQGEHITCRANKVIGQPSNQRTMILSDSFLELDMFADRNFVFWNSS